MIIGKEAQQAIEYFLENVNKFMKTQATLKLKCLLKPTLLAILIMLFNNQSQCQSYNKKQITQLGIVIQKKILQEGSNGYDVIVVPKITKLELSYFLKNNFLRNHIKTAFNTKDEIEINHIIENYIDEKLIFRYKDPKISIVNATDENKQEILLQLLSKKGLPKFDYLLVLLNKDKNKAIVYYHIINAGDVLAILEKKETGWDLIESIVETIE
ncbi:MAG: hypothetical protein RLZ56_5 [Bacteroidota bacterium]|jgi:hypothetical protein